MIIYYYCISSDNALLLAIIFTNLPSLQPLSFHEMIVVFVDFFSKYSVYNQDHNSTVPHYMHAQQNDYTFKTNTRKSNGTIYIKRNCISELVIHTSNKK